MKKVWVYESEGVWGCGDWRSVNFYQTYAFTVFWKGLSMEKIDLDLLAK